VTIVVCARAPLPNYIDHAGLGIRSYRRTVDDEYDLHLLASHRAAVKWQCGAFWRKPFEVITGMSVTALDAALYNKENVGRSEPQTSPTQPHVCGNRLQICRHPLIPLTFEIGAKSSGSSPNTRGRSRMSKHRGIGGARGPIADSARR
jgi:hypothetical protein